MQDVSKILTRKYYGKKDPFRSREFRQPRWMELLAVLLFTVSGLGEGKSINVVLGGLPKAVTLAPGSWVTVDGAYYRVLEPHTLDEWKNEFEVRRREDC